MIVFGLGNPGAKYENTRHNVGFMLADRLAAFYDLKFRKRCFSNFMQAKNTDIKIVKPLTYMNNSGEVFPSLCKSDYKIIVIVDNMDLPVGKLRIKNGGSSAGHNGLKSIIRNIGDNFIRVYIGVGRPNEGESVPDYVLSDFSAEDKEKLEKVFSVAITAIDSILKGEQLTLVIQKANSFTA